jgi:hypothetical protein
MQPYQRVITQLLLQELFDENGPVTAERQRDLSKEVIQELLRTRVVQFVTADVGAKPVWVPAADRFTFWKAEAGPHLADPETRNILENYSSGYCYFASEWLSANSTTLVVLERHH